MIIPALGQNIILFHFWIYFAFKSDIISKFQDSNPLKIVNCVKDRKFARPTS